MAEATSPTIRSFGPPSRVTGAVRDVATGDRDGVVVMVVRGDVLPGALGVVGGSPGAGGSVAANGAGGGPFGEAARAAIAELATIEGQLASLEGRADQLRARAGSLRSLVAVLEELGAAPGGCGGDGASFAPSTELSSTPLPVRVSTTHRIGSNGAVGVHRRV